MRVLLAGGTGFVGRPLTEALLARGDRVTVVTRDPTGARRRGLPGVEYRGWLPDLALHDAVVNLSGEGVLEHRWTPAVRQTLVDSRLETTAQLVRALADAPASGPRVLVNASAVGYYGDRGMERLPETAARGRGFLAALCEHWEHAARQASVRSVQLRIGVVLGRGGGALASMLPVFRRGLGGPFGAGGQQMPWVHVADVCGLVLRALDDARACGPINVTAPGVVSSRAFAATLGAALRRPALFPVPKPVLRAMLGEGASVLLASQRCVPEAADRLGYTFRFPELRPALDDLLGARASGKIAR
ncbi:MAG: TIGR01777 family protein [Planctomycetes bacterium]|nr:TIGR01777 family protein [Planctomycetota bacterium]